ncbi:MAG: hypothetical protein AUI14_23280 [Actinobacteria bacterium 13_2_20CM_2_71_6]|nr:MAG: hypothetical protein AUI14_23280 [Actinobacteria bacterium 13_2_20CM_2_71_6]
MPRRRLLAVAVAGALALSGLAACRDQPAVAAYVGSVQLTNADVEKVAAEFPEETRARAMGAIRQFVVSSFVIGELSRQLAREHGITVPPVDVAPFADEAARDAVPANGGFIRLLAEAEIALRTIQPLGKAQAPTEADKREVFAALVNDRKVSPDQYNDVKDQIDSASMRVAFGLRPLLRDSLSKYQVTVNPRYQPLSLDIPFTVGNVQSRIALSLEPAGRKPAVVDLNR